MVAQGGGAKKGAGNRGKPNANASAKANANAKARLAVEIDGAALSDDEARAIWEAFSAWMDDHRGDMAGFARERGYASVEPTYRRGRAVLIVRRA